MLQNGVTSLQWLGFFRGCMKLWNIEESYHISQEFPTISMPCFFSVCHLAWTVKTQDKQGHKYRFFLLVAGACKCEWRNAKKHGKINNMNLVNYAQRNMRTNGILIRMHAVDFHALGATHHCTCSALGPRIVTSFAERRQLTNFYDRHYFAIKDSISMEYGYYVLFT